MFFFACKVPAQSQRCVFFTVQVNSHFSHIHQREGTETKCVTLVTQINLIQSRASPLFHNQSNVMFFPTQEQECVLAFFAIFVLFVFGYI